MNQPQSIALLFPEIKELLNERNYVLLKEVLRECGVLDFADMWRKFSEEERVQIFKILPTGSALKLFEILDLDDQRYLLGRLGEVSVPPSPAPSGEGASCQVHPEGENSAAQIMESIDSPDLAKIFHKMSPRMVKKMSSLIKRQECLERVDYLMKFPENTVGSLMHPEFVKLTPKITAKQALLRLSAVIRPGGQKEHLYALFVVDDEGRVMGSTTVQDLISAPEDEKLLDVMNSVEGVKLKPEMDQEEAAKIFSKYDLNSAPVVDENGKLIGILTVRDILSIIRQEATEDIAKMAGTRAKDLREQSALKIVFFRMPWLLVTLGGGLLISLIIRHYEPIIAKAIALASFSPLIAGMGGNVGSQSATIVVRSLALGHLESRADQVKAIFREFRVGIMLGVVYGLMLATFAYVVYGHQYGIEFGFVVAIGMGTSMTVAATMGALEPIFFHRFGVDPATATGPLITTITDIISNLTYFALATVLLMHL